MTDDQLKMMSLLVFTFQNAAFVLLMRWSKVLDTHYNSTVAVSSGCTSTRWGGRWPAGRRYEAPRLEHILREDPSVESEEGGVTSRLSTDARANPHAITLCTLRC